MAGGSSHGSSVAGRYDTAANERRTHPSTQENVTYGSDGTTVGRVVRVECHKGSGRLGRDIEPMSKRDAAVDVSGSMSARQRGHFGAVGPSLMAFAPLQLTDVRTVSAYHRFR